MADIVATAAAQAKIEQARNWLRANFAELGIVAILVLAALLRFNGLDWDESKYLHPDERFVTMVATGIDWPDSVSEYFDSENSSLNPYNNEFGTFIYGTFPLFLDKLVADIDGRNVYGNFHLIARSISAVFDLITVLLIFLVGRRLFTSSTALLASLLYAVTVLQIQISHFGTFDTFVTTLCLASFYFAIRADQNGRWWEYALTGISVGLAVATKLSALPIVALVALPVIEQIRLRGWRHVLGKSSTQRVSPVIGAALALICIVWTFRITQPYAFLGPSPFSFKFDPRWTEDVRRWRDVSAGLGNDPPSVQWANRTPFLYIIENIVRWGLGIPLGITMLIGLALGSIRLAIARRWPPTSQVVLIGWALFQIGYYGTAFQKPIRYPSPAYPFFALIAAALLIHILQRGLRRPEAIRRVLYAAPMVLVVALTAAYAIAFTGIYSRTSTRIAASEWIYQNVPEGTTVLSEHWDDGLPLLLPEYPMGIYTGEELELYHDDNQEKLDHMLDQLNRADFIFLSSNRLYKSIPRIPERFPMSIEYYSMLFSGDLGYELVATFESRPEIFGWEIVDDNADESFTVYDHPKVLIYQKTSSFNLIDVELRLTDALYSQEILRLSPIETGFNFLMFEDDERVVQQEGGTWSDIFDRGDILNRHPVRFWYLALQLMALTAMPLCWRVLRGLPDRGYAVSKTIGLLTAGYVAWLLPSLKVISFGRSAVLLGIGITAAASIAITLKQWPEMVRDLRSRWRELLFVEVLFLAAFFLFVWFRSKNPDLWDPYRGGEKPMEFAYFNAIIRSTHFPPYDPWFAGGYINYYYFGYVLLAAVTRLTGIIPAVAFNLAVPALFALLVLNSWSFVRNMLGLIKIDLGGKARWSTLAAGLLGPFFVVGLGNLDLARRVGRGEYGFGVWRGDADLGLGTVFDVIRGIWNGYIHFHLLPGDAYWSPTRVIPGTVNEFPNFTYLFADFHPHMAGLTVTSAVLVLALAVIQARRWPVEPSDAPIEAPEELFTSKNRVIEAIRSIPWGLALDRTLLVALVAFVTGMLFPLNTWDFPTYVLMIVIAFALLELVGNRTDASESNVWLLSYSTLRRAAIWSGATVVLGRLLFVPYFAHYHQSNSGFDDWTGIATEPGQYVIIHGIMLFFVCSYLIAELTSLSSKFRFSVPHLQRYSWISLPSDKTTRTLALTFGKSNVSFSPLAIILAAAVVIAFMAFWQDRLLWLLSALLLLVTAVAWHRRREPIQLFLCSMAAVALALSGAVERYALRGDIGRFNTVFKFYLQVWVLFALVAAVGTAVLFARYRARLGRYGRAAWSVAAAILLLAGFLYPALATPARLDDRFNDLPRTLNGMAYMQEAEYDDAPPGGDFVTYDLNGGGEITYRLRQGDDIIAYPLKDDLDAINWLLDNVEGSPVILEGVTSLYRWGSRVSINTGLPTVLGWDWHQTQQRSGYGELVNQRRDDVNFMFGANVGFPVIRSLLDKYHVKYIYVGALEHVYYDQAALDKFDNAVTSGQLIVAYQNTAVTIYAYEPAITMRPGGTT